MTGPSIQPFEKARSAAALLADQSGRCTFAVDSAAPASNGEIRHSAGDTLFALRALLDWHFVGGIGRKIIDHLRSSARTSVSSPPDALDVFAKLNHEIRTPLNAILGFSELMLLRNGIPARERRALMENIHASGQRLLSIIEAILDDRHWSIDIASLDKRPLNVRQQLAETLGMLRRKIERSGCSCFLLADDDLFIDADCEAFRRMLVGLLSHPLRHSGPDSLILISAGRCKADTFIEVRCKDLLGGGRDRRDGLELDRARALALAHGGRLHMVEDSDAQRIARLTFFATCAVQ